jgi:ribosomal protein L15
MGGTGKRADHKKQWAKRIAKKAGAKSYFGQQGFTSRGTAKKKYDKINLEDILANFSGSKIDLSSYKILEKAKDSRQKYCKICKCNAIER